MTTPIAPFKRKHSPDALTNEGIRLDKELRDALKSRAKRAKVSYSALCRVFLRLGLEMDLSVAQIREQAEKDTCKPGYHTRWVKLSPAPKIQIAD